MSKRALKIYYTVCFHQNTNTHCQSCYPRHIPYYGENTGSGELLHFMCSPPENQTFVIVELDPKTRTPPVENSDKGTCRNGALLVYLQDS